MKRMLAVTLCALAAPPALAADVGVSVTISEPGVYGRIDIGRFPSPPVIVPQPVIIAPPGVVVAPVQPIYMWVPYDHRKNWARYCAHYRACGYPVYFVRHDWYNREVRGHREFRGDERGHEGRGRGHDGGGPGKGRGRGRD
jgi:hypothetical protein